MPFLSRRNGSKRDHDSDASSEEEGGACTVPCDSGNGIFDEIDHVPNSARLNISRANLRPLRHGEYLVGVNGGQGWGVDSNYTC